MTTIPTRRFSARIPRSGRTNALLASVGLLFAFVVMTPDDASAKQCHVRVSASGRFQGSVVDQGAGAFTRNAVKVEYDLQGVSFRYDFDNLPQCPSTPGDVEISADSSSDPLMFHFMSELAGEAKVKGRGLSHRFDQVNATVVEFQTATRQLQFGGLGRAWIVLGITAGWDAVQAVVPLGVPVKLATDFGIEAIKEAVKGGNGDGLTKWLKWKVPSLIATLGLESEEAKAIADGLQNAAKGIDRELADKLKPVVITRNGKAGECDIYYSATLDLKANRYHVNFDKYCGKREPEVPTAQGTSVSVDPGAGDKIVVKAVNHLGIPYPLKAATIAGLVPVMTDGSAEPAAVIAAGSATFNFTAAKPRKDGVYAVTVNLTTFDDKTARWDGSVTVNNVAPQVSSVTPNETNADPGTSMSLQNVMVTLTDDNADKNNPGEVKAGDLKLGPHPAELKMTRNNAFGNIDGTPQQQFDGSSGTYVLTFNRDGGRVKKPHMHKTVTTEVTIKDDNGLTANGTVSFKVNDVAPKVANVKLNPQFVHRNVPPLTITLTGRFTDDNGSEDIDRPESYADVSKATSGGIDKLVLGQDLAIKGAPGDDFIEFEGGFPQTNEVGAHKIDIFGHDKKEGEHPDGPHEGKGDITLNVGNAKPVINPWGYIYDNTELGGTPIQDQRGGGLCPGQSFLAGIGVTDPENDPVLAWATIKETGVRVALTRAPGERTYKAILYAPGEPGEYTLLFEARERDLDQVADPKTSQLTVIPCEEDAVDDLGWESRVQPQTLCPTDPFTAEAFIIYYLKNKTQKRVYPPGTITFLGSTKNVGPLSSVASFTAPGAPGVYPVSIVIDINGTPTNLNPQVTVDPCGAIASDDVISLPGGDTELVADAPATAAGDLDVPYDILSNPDLLNPVSGSRDMSVQLMFVDVVADELEPIVALADARQERNESRFFMDVLQQVRGRSLPAARPGYAGAQLLYASAIRGRGYAPVTRRVRRSTPRTVQLPSAETPRVSAFITSLGTSYGESMQLQIFNTGDAPVRLSGKGIVVEPLKREAQKQMQKQLSDLAGSNPVTVKVNAYCLEFLREPPSLGTVFRIAEPELQQKFAPMRHVMDASRKLQELGSLTPDTEAAEYFHSVRQWSIWSKERGFDDEKSFGKAFVERTKKNFEASGQSFTKQIESAVRDLVPNRWRDVSAVLSEAERLSALDTRGAH